MRHCLIQSNFHLYQSVNLISNRFNLRKQTFLSFVIKCFDMTSKAMSAKDEKMENSDSQLMGELHQICTVSRPQQ